MKKRLKMVLLMLALRCCVTTRVITASPRDVREEMEFLFREPKTDIFAPATEAAMQVISVVVMIAIIVVIVIGLVWFIKQKIKWLPLH